MSAPTVSVLVTVFNRETYLGACLESILASTWRDFEVIVVDDRSSDGSVEIARKWEKRDDRVRVHMNESNQGDYPNRNRAASLAKGKYLKYLDADDLIYPYGLQAMVDAMERFPDAALGVSCSLPEDSEPYPFVLSQESAFLREFLGGGILSCGPSGAIMRRDAFEAVGSFSQKRLVSDREMWLRLATRAPVAVMPPALVWWRRHQGQESMGSDSRQFYLEHGFAVDMEALTRPECPLSEMDRQTSLRRRQQQHARRLLALVLRNGQLRTGWRLFCESNLSWYELLGGFRRYGQSADID